MFQYFFSFDREKHQILVNIQFEKVETNKLILQLPAWRPGRYQLQNFAKNILDFKAEDQSGNLKWQKIHTNIWEIETSLQTKVNISYKYYAAEINAGSSFVNSEMIYVNPINVCLYRPQDLNTSFNVTLLHPEEQKLTFAGGPTFSQSNSSTVLNLKDYHEFFDMPFILSQKIRHFGFTAKNTPFHFWIQGSYTLDIERFIEDIKKVTEYQIQLFGRFPEEEYHFLLIIPYGTFYHGVEHRNSTVMVLGEQGVLTSNSYNDLLGLASHELFHTWNIAKIRPKELLPYDYTKENFFTTCFVAEGFTTYFGDRILLDSGVFSREQYRFELETTFKRHFIENDNSSQSLLESSFDLWVDGYEKGTPNKKVSVYHKGAIATLILDVTIREKWNNSRSMEDVMLKLYSTFGDLSKGYAYTDIKQICEEVYGENLDSFFKDIIESNQPILNQAVEALAHLGFELIFTEESLELRNFAE